MKHKTMFALAAAAMLLSACEEPGPPSFGPEPDLPKPSRGVLPHMVIAEPAPWGDEQPVVPEGYEIRAIATDLAIPRQSLLLPNGDILVAEGRGGNAPNLKPKDVIAGYIKAKGTSSVKGGNRLTLLRDADGDGVAETRHVLLADLFSPFGMALVGDQLYIANADAVVRVPYRDGQTRIDAIPAKVAELPGGPINHHWTKSLVASADGKRLYVGVGSNSNVGENGMAHETDRAAVLEIDPASGQRRVYASGLRNPVGLAWEPATGALWVVVNERDEIGDQLVPDYLTRVREGAFYGWPYSYYGAHVDARVQPPDPAKVASAIAPDYALGAHVAALGLAFAHGEAMPARFREGAFIGLHGSWNRAEPAGYKVVFVPFSRGEPAGPPVDVLTGFLDGDGNAHGRPVGVAFDRGGALLVADDVGNVIWRVAPR